MHGFAGMKTLDVWYAHATVSDLEELLRSQARRSEIGRFDRTVAEGMRKDSARAFAKLAARGNGEARIVADPPVIVPVEDLVADADAQRIERAARDLVRSYVASLPCAP